MNYDFNGKTRMGLPISQKIKQIWSINLNLLKTFSEICSELDINWWVHSSTLVGAIMTKGFLPNDVFCSVAMLRHDFEKLLQYDGLKAPYVLQSYKSEPMAGITNARLRNTATTFLYINEQCSPFQYNKGMYLDIIPFDTVPSDNKDLYDIIKKSYNILQESYKLKNNMIRKYSLDILTKTEFDQCNQIIADNTTNFINLCKIYNEQAGNYITDYNEYINNTNKCILKSDIEHLQDMPFENITVKIPKNSIAILDKLYVDWQKKFVNEKLKDIFIIDAHTPFSIALKNFSNTYSYVKQ